MKDLYVIVDRFGEVELVHCPDRVKAVQLWEAAAGFDPDKLRGNAAVKRFLEGGEQAVYHLHDFHTTSLTAVTIKEIL